MMYMAFLIKGKFVLGRFDYGKNFGIIGGEFHSGVKFKLCKWHLIMPMYATNRCALVVFIMWLDIYVERWTHTIKTKLFFTSTQSEWYSVAAGKEETLLLEVIRKWKENRSRCRTPP